MGHRSQNQIKIEDWCKTGLNKKLENKEFDETKKSVQNKKISINQKIRYDQRV